MKYKVFFIIMFLALIIASECIRNQPPKSITKEFKQQESMVNNFILYATNFSRLAFGLKHYTFKPYFYLIKNGRIFKSKNINEMLNIDGFLYKNEFLDEEAKISIPICTKYRFFYRRGALENVFLSKERDERIVNFKEENLEVKDKNGDVKMLKTVSFLLKSGIVLQVADISELNINRGIEKKAEPKYKIVRIYFVGNNINKKDFPKAEIRDMF